MRFNQNQSITKMISILACICLLVSLHSSLALLQPCDKCELHVAAAIGDTRALTKALTKALVQQRLVNQPDINGKSPLFLAVESRSTAAVQLLLKQPGIDVDAVSYLSGATPLFVSVAQREMLLLLLAAGADATITTKAGESVLQEAARLNFEGVVEPLLISSQIVRQSINVPSPSTGQTPLHMAAEHGNLNNVRVLLEKDGGFADCNVRIQTSGATALLLSAAKGSVEVVRHLLKTCDGIDMDASDSQEWTPFMAAARIGQVDILRLLLDYKKDEIARANLLNHMTESKTQTALIVAVHESQRHVVQFLLQQPLIKHDSHVLGGWNALMVACETGDVGIVEDLLNQNQKDNGASNRALRKNGWSTLHTATAGGFTKIVRALMRHTTTNLLNLEGKDAHTPLSLAAWNNYVDIVHLYIQDGRTNLNHQIHEKRSMTALHLAAQRGHLDVVRALTESKRVDISLESIDRLTALDVSRKNKNQFVEKFLSRLTMDKERKESEKGRKKRTIDL